MTALPKNAIYLKLLIKFLVSAQKKKYNLVVLSHNLFPKRQQILEVIKFLKLNVSVDSTLAASSQVFFQNSSSLETTETCSHTDSSSAFGLICAFPSFSLLSASCLLRNHYYFRMLQKRKWTYTKFVVISSILF